MPTDVLRAEHQMILRALAALETASGRGDVGDRWWDEAVAWLRDVLDRNHHGLARPPLNILDLAMLDELNAALECAAMHPRLEALVLAGEGETFSAGIAAVRGAAIATFCDVVIAANDATLGQPEITRGVFPPIAVLHYPARVGYAHALRLILGGEVITAAEALRIGLVDHVVSADRLTQAIAAELARYQRHSACALRLTRRAMQGARGMDFDQGLATLEELDHHELLTTADAEEGLRAFLEKRPPVWRDR